MSLFEISKAFKPFRYPWAYEAYIKQRQMYWIPEEISFDTDIYDWNNNLSDSEKNLVTQVLRFLVQADSDIASGYLDKYIPMFKPAEVRMMLSTFAMFEAIHLQSYSLPLDALGMADVEYSAFNEYAAMRDKHEYLFKYRGDFEPIERTALELAIFSAFGEGMQLFSSFAILLNFSKAGHNRLSKIGRLITLIVKDENWHVTSMIRLFHALLDENPSVWTDKLKAAIYQACRDMVELEDKFIDLAFEMGDLKDLSKEDVKQYIRYIADRRLLELHLKPEYGVKVNPLPWIEQMINMDEFVNFFESEVTEYSSAMLSGEWSDVESNDLFSVGSIEKFIANR